MANSNLFTFSTSFFQWLITDFLLLPKNFDIDNRCDSWNVKAMLPHISITEFEIFLDSSWDSKISTVIKLQED